MASSPEMRRKAFTVSSVAVCACGLAAVILCRACSFCIRYTSVAGESFCANAVPAVMPSSSDIMVFFINGDIRILVSSKQVNE